jgi:glutamyl-tRNA synthetase
MVRVRFAPSPTGELHVGGARTALYNYLFAKQQKGKFIIRIEDTDQERFVPGSLERLLEGLAWLGLTWDEGPDVGGKFAPYIQSERLSHYQKYAAELVEKGAAYYCFCTKERLDVLRELQQSEGKPTKYDRTCLKLTSADVAAQLKQQLPHTIRLKVPEGTTTFHDEIRGDITVPNADIDDQVLLKSDGFPTYHLACVVDDHLMEISHVIRGEEWLPSTPKHVLLYRAFGWQPTQFAHLPNVLNERKAKLSKRKDGEAVWVQTYRSQGYLPQALLNFLALLGWHPKDDQELFTLAELAKAFELTRVQKAGAIFNREKLDWFNAAYIKQLPTSELDSLLQPLYQVVVGDSHLPHTLRLTALLQPRLVTLGEAGNLSQWFFKPDTELNVPAEMLIPKNGSLEKTAAALEAVAGVLTNRVGEWEVEPLRAAVEVLVRPGTFTRAELLWPLRVALTGEKQSPDVFDVALALGRERSLLRLKAAQNTLGAA